MSVDPLYRSVWRSASGELVRVVEVAYQFRAARPPLRVVRFERVVEARCFGDRIFVHVDYLRRLSVATFHLRYPERVA